MRSYQHYCGVARALDILGDRWTLLILRDLLVGPLRYSELRRGLPGLTTNLLATRLEELQQAGLVSKNTTPPPASIDVYALTATGHRVRPVLFALGEFGEEFLGVPAPEEHRSPRALVVRWMRRTHQVRRDGPTHDDAPVGQVQLWLSNVPYRVQVDRTETYITTGQFETPAAVLRCDWMTLGRVVALGQEDAWSDVAWEGDQTLVRRALLLPPV